MMALNALGARHPAETTIIQHDIMRTRSWGLLHHPSALTYAHHDAAGQHTWVLNMSGYKFWVLFKLKPEYAKGTEAERIKAILNIHMPEHMLAMDAFDAIREDFNAPLPWEPYVDMELVVLEPGSLL